LLLFQRGHGVRVVGHGIQHTVAGHHGRSHPVHIGIQQVGAVAGRVHPRIFNRGRVGTDRYVFLDQTEARPSLRGAFREARLVVIAVCNGPFGHHAQTMPSCGFGQRRIPLQRRNPLRGAVLVD
jgi:hypothetical protein